MLYIELIILNVSFISYQILKNDIGSISFADRKGNLYNPTGTGNRSSSVGLQGTKLGLHHSALHQAVYEPPFRNVS